MITVKIAQRLFLATALVAACAPAAASGSLPQPSAGTLAAGVYVYHPAPLVWEMVTVADGNVSGAVFEWNCAGERWAIGRIPASVAGSELRFGDDRYAITDGLLDARWQPNGVDPRGLPRPVCSGATPTPKSVLSGDAARALIKQTVTAISPVLVPTSLPDRVSATVTAQPRSFAVTYATDAGVRVTLQTALTNPQPMRNGGSQRHLRFRKDGGAFYQALDGDVKTLRTLLWSEPVTDPSKATIPGCSCTSYALTSEGLTEVEFWNIAESLQ